MIIFKPARKGQASVLYVSVCGVWPTGCCSVSDSWGIGDLNLTGTLIRPVYWHCCTAQNIVIDEKYIDDENGENFDKAKDKLTVVDVQDEQDFRLEDEVTEDSTEQIDPKQFPCEESEYYAKYVNKLKGHKLAQHEGVQSSYDQC